MGKQRSHITKFIAQNKLRQEFVPLLGKYVDLLKAEPLHNTSFPSRWTTKERPCVVSHTWRFRHFKTASRRELSGRSETVVASLRWVWFVSCITTESAAENQFCQALMCITFSYGFKWLESKYFCWHFATLIKELLKTNSLSKGSVVKLHTLAFVVVKFRDAVSIYSRVEVRIEQVEKLKTSCQHTPGSLTSDAWASIQCRVERQSMLSWLSMWKTNAMPKRAYSGGECLNTNLSTWCAWEKGTPTALLITSKRGISAILTFLGEFEIVTTGFAIVDFYVRYFFHYGAVSKQSVTQFPPT